MSIEWKLVFKIGLSIGVLICAVSTGLILWSPPITVDAFISQFKNENSIGNTFEQTRSLIVSEPILDSPNPVSTSPMSTKSLIELPSSYYVKPTPKPIAAPLPIQNVSPESILVSSTLQPHTITPTYVTSSITIPAIGLQNITYSIGSLENISDIEQKLLYGPVRDSAFAQEPCIPNTHSYVMGHSQPAYQWQSSYPGTSIFGSLNTLQPGDKIYIINGQSVHCTYEVIRWDTVITENDTVSIDEFNKLLYPDISQDTILSIQTCQLGSATVRLILRAKMI